MARTHSIARCPARVGLFARRQLSPALAVLRDAAVTGGLTSITAAPEAPSRRSDSGPERDSNKAATRGVPSCPWEPQRLINVAATAASARLENPLRQGWRRRPASPEGLGLKPAFAHYKQVK